MTGVQEDFFIQMKRHLITVFCHWLPFFFKIVSPEAEAAKVLGLSGIRSDDGVVLLHGRAQQVRDI